MLEFLYVDDPKQNLSIVLITRCYYQSIVFSHIVIRWYEAMLVGVIRFLFFLVDYKIKEWNTHILISILLYISIKSNLKYIKNNDKIKCKRKTLFLLKANTFSTIKEFFPLVCLYPSTFPNKSLAKDTFEIHCIPQHK